MQTRDFWDVPSDNTACLKSTRVKLKSQTNRFMNDLMGPILIVIGGVRAVTIVEDSLRTKLYALKTYFVCVYTHTHIYI